MVKYVYMRDVCFKSTRKSLISSQNLLIDIGFYKRMDTLHPEKMAGPSKETGTVLSKKQQDNNNKNK